MRILVRAGLMVVLLSALDVSTGQTATGLSSGEAQIVYEAGSWVAVIDPDGSDRTYLTEEGVDGDPSWSPDRSRVAFHSDRDDPNHDIFLMNADGSDETNLTGHFRGSDEELWPAWSPLGDEIAFCGGDFVWVFPLDGSRARWVSGFTADCPGVAWSPDGSQLVYSANYGHPNFELWIVNADGTGRRRLTRTADDEAFPDWSPDGKTILFDRNDSRGKSGIFVINVDGTGLRGLSPNRSFDRDPVWSPDGTQIAFVRDLPCDSHIWIMDADGSDRRQVTEDPVCNSSPDW
jgi:Tol biopolymer transport system component